ncbi:MAG: RNA repair domain-containing protein [Methanoregula sp.]|nr:RNA repair domain-containing protein [Methanoregula sp.]
MLTSHKLLEQFWHDDRYDSARVKVWYIDRGAPHDRSMVNGPDICLEPYYMEIRTPQGMKPIPYHRILLISYDGVVEFENRKIEGEAHTLIGESPGTT